jgi:hypothetical protein
LERPDHKSLPESAIAVDNAPRRRYRSERGVLDDDLLLIRIPTHTFFPRLSRYFRQSRHNRTVPGTPCGSLWVINVEKLGLTLGGSSPYDWSMTTGLTLG